MKIALIHHQYQRKGGMETYLGDLVQGFYAQEDEVNAIVYKYKSDKSLPDCQIEKYFLSWLPRSWRKFWFALLLQQKSIRQKYDLSLSLMRSFNQDIIICGGTHRGFLNHMNRKSSLHDKIEIYFEQKGYQKTPIIIAHSDMLQKEIISLYHINPKKIHRIYPPVNIDSFNLKLRPQRDSLRAKYNIDNQKTTLLFPSTGHKRKGILLLIEAMRQLPAANLEMIVAGDHLPNMPENIKCVGFVQNMAELYTACDFTVLPSFYEPFGLVIVESLQCGTPVIISKHVGAKDLISENEGVIIETLTVRGILAAISQAMKSKFTIAADFAQKNNLTIEDHIRAIKSLSGTKNT
jgi:glycosyltransferase involved in cell wall biosynthesis